MVTTAQKTVNDPNAEKRSASGYHGIEVSGVSTFIFHTG
jgi:hypothetical protein